MEMRVPPHSDEAEVSSLGAMLLSRDAISAASEILLPEDFYSPAHQKIYGAILELDEKNEPADIVTVSEELTRQNVIDEIGGMSYLASLSSAVGTIANTEFYCKIIKEKSILRKLIGASDDIISNSYNPEARANSVIEIAEKTIFEITQDSMNNGLIPLKEALLDSFSLMDKRAQNKNALTGVTTGFTDLDRKLAGLQKSDLVLIAARPSMGKTALMVNITTNAAQKGDAKVAIFSLEMSKNQLVQRMISAATHIDLMKIISGSLNEEEWTKVINSMTVLQNLNISIDDTPGMSPVEMKAKCRRLKAEKGLDLVVIDYLQLMELSSRTESRQQEISAISRSLNALAKELDVPVVALSQLSRAPELRSDHRPVLSDLRESGAIEQDADVVMFLYRDDYYNKEESKEPNVGEVIIAKHRNGPTGTIKLVFKKEFTKFLNMER